MQGPSILKMTLLALAVALVGGVVSLAVKIFSGSGFSAPDVDFRSPLDACPAPPVTPDLDHRLPPAECSLTSRPAQLPSIRVMQALATNDRHLAGARCPGSLISPTVRMLA